MLQHHILKTVLICFILAGVSCERKVEVTTVRFQNLGERGKWTRVAFPEDGVERHVPKVYANNILHRERKKIESALDIGSLENGCSV